MKHALWVTPLPFVLAPNKARIEALVTDDIEIRVLRPTSTRDIVDASAGMDIVVLGSAPATIDIDGIVANVTASVFRPVMTTVRNDRNEPERRLAGYTLISA